MDEIKEINLDSTKEVVAEYLKSNFAIDDTAKENIIKENITGEILFCLDINDLKSLDVKGGARIKIHNLIKDNQGKFQEKKIDEKITSTSNFEEVKAFLDKCLDFKGDLKDLDGKRLLELQEEEMKKFGLNMGQRKKLIKYINHFIKIENENPKETTSTEFQLTEKSSEDEVAKFLKEKLNFSDESIAELGLDGESLFLIGEEELNSFSIKDEEKEKLKNLLNKIKKKPEETGGNKELINISNKSNEEETIKFLKSLKFSDNSINLLKETEVYLNGEFLFLLDEDDIDDMDITDEEKNSLKEFLNKEKKENINQNDLKKISYNIEESEKKIFYPLKNCIITPVIMDAKYNTFFCLYYISNFDANFSISTYKEKKKKFLNYKPIILAKTPFYIKQNYEKIGMLSVLFQIPSYKDTKELFLTIKDKNNGKEYKTQIDNKKKIPYYFYLDNLSLKDDNFYNKIFIEQTNNSILYDFFNFFLDKKNENENFQKYLIKSIIAKIEKNKDGINFNIDNTLKFFKYCAKYNFELKKLDYFHLSPEKGKIALNKEFCLSSEEINILTKNKNCREKIINIYVEIYANHDKECLMELIQSDKSKDYCKAILGFLVKRTIKPTELSLSFNNKEKIPIFQKNLLSNSKTRDELNIIIKLSENLAKSLEFIYSNYNDIYSILEKNSNKVFYKEASYLLTLPNPNANEEINEIYSYLIKIFKERHNEKKYKIINLEELFKQLIDYYGEKSLNELCSLNNFVNLLKEQNIESNYFEILYNQIHYKIMKSITNNNLKVSEIIDLVKIRDIFYYDAKYSNNDNRDPSIFKYIPITDIDKDYKNNIELLKKTNLCYIFKESEEKKRKKFYSTLLEQMKKVLDFNSIFDLFQLEEIETIFILSMNVKLEEIKYTCLEEKKENMGKIFKIFENIFRLNCSNKNLSYDFPIKVVQFNYEFASKFYFYLLEQKDLYESMIEAKTGIIDYFIDQTRTKSQNAESLISLLLLSPDKNFSVHLQNKMEYLIIKENDFYQIEENDNFRLFELFFEKYSELIKNPFISEGTYLVESIKIKSRILDDLENNRISYNRINKIIQVDDKENEIENEDNELLKQSPLFRKLLVITSKNEQESIKIFNKLKESFEICQQRFKKFEIIKDFYNTFYKNTKGKIINEIKKKLDELAETNLEEILDLDEYNYIKDDDFNLEEAIE